MPTKVLFSCRLDENDHLYHHYFLGEITEQNGMDGLFGTRTF